MTDEPKKTPVPAKVREEMERGVPQRQAVSYAELKKGERK